MNKEIFNHNNTPCFSQDKNLISINKMLPSINKKSETGDSSIIYNQNFSIIQQEKEIQRIYSSNNNKRNKDNLFRNDNSLNNQYYSNNNINSSNLVNKENYFNPLNIIPINLVKNINKRKIFENNVNNHENSRIENENKIEINIRKHPVFVPKIIVNHNRNISPNNNFIKEWKI